MAKNLDNFKNATFFQKNISFFISNTYPDNEEVSLLRQLFLMIDNNRDGKMTLQELQQALSSVLNDTPNEKLQQLFADLGLDQNGFVDYTEFLSAASNKEKLLCDENLAKAYKNIDINNDGFITMKELKKTLGLNDNEIAKLWKEIIIEVDVNGDEKIDY